MRPPEEGFTLVEVVVATVIVTVGLAGLTAMLRLSGQGVQESRHLTAAVFLAEERMEQVHGAPWDSTVGDCLGVSPSPARPPVTSTCPGAGADHVSFPDENPGTLRVPFDRYTRAVRVEPCTGSGICPAASPDLRRVTIVIGYGSTSGMGRPGGDGAQTITVRRLVAKRL